MTKGVVTRRGVTPDDVVRWPLVTSSHGYSLGEVERFLAKVDVGKPSECWPWLSAVAADRTGRGGYGVLTRSRSNTYVYAHRMSYELARGAIADGMECAHRCNNSRCVNPSHLYQATRQENAQDACRDGLIQHRRGAAAPKAVLTDQQVREIRASWTSSTVSRMALRYSVSRDVIGRAGRGETYRDAGPVPRYRNTGVKLSVDDVRAIRNRRKRGELLRVLAEEYGVCESHISRVTRGLSRADL